MRKLEQEVEGKGSGFEERYGSSGSSVGLGRMEVGFN